VLALFQQKNKDPKIAELKKILGFKPGDVELYRQALMHKSWSENNRDGVRWVHNERLEFLGDSILDAIVAAYLFEVYSHKMEGFLSKLKSSIVKRKSLNDLAVKIGVDKIVMHRLSPRTNYKHVYGNALEALIGAVYMDKGYEKTRRFVLERLITKHIDLDKLVIDKSNFKSDLLELGQKNGRVVTFESYLKYMNLDKIPYFCAVAKIDDIVYGEGIGRSKKKAEQKAAEIALSSYSE